MFSSYFGFAAAVKQLSPYVDLRSQLFALCSQAAMVARAFSRASECAPRTVPETSVHPHGSTTFHIQNADPSRPTCSRTMEWSCRRRGVIGAKLWQGCHVPDREPASITPVPSASARLEAAGTRTQAGKVERHAPSVLTGEGRRQRPAHADTHRARERGIAASSHGVARNGGRVADAAPAGVAGEIDMDVVVMESVRARRQHRRELLARSGVDVVQESALLGRAVPAVLHRDPAAVREREGRDIERIAEG